MKTTFAFKYKNGPFNGSVNLSEQLRLHGLIMSMDMTDF